MTEIKMTENVKITLRECIPLPKYIITSISENPDYFFYPDSDPDQLQSLRVSALDHNTPSDIFRAVTTSSI